MKLPAFLSSSYEAVSSASSGLFGARESATTTTTGGRSKRSSTSSGGGQLSKGFLRSWTQRLFLLTVVAEASFLITNAALLLRNPWWKWHIDNFTRVVFAVMPSMVILTIDAFRTANLVEVIGVSLFNIPILVYHIVQRVQAEPAYFAHTTHPNGLACPPAVVHEPQCAAFVGGWAECIGLLTAAPAVIGASQLLFAYWTWTLAAEFGWHAFRLLGGDVRLKTLHGWEQRLSTLLKIDFFFTAIYATYNTIYAAQALRDVGLSFTVHLMSLIVIVLQYLLLLAPLLGLLALWQEWDLLMYFVLAFLVLGTAALTTLVWVFVYGPRLAWDWYSQAMRDFMVVLTAIDSALAGLTAALGMYLVVAQFGRGLREAKRRGRAKAELLERAGAGGRRVSFASVRSVGSDESVGGGGEGGEGVRMVIE